MKRRSAVRNETLIEQSAIAVTSPSTAKGRADTSQRHERWFFGGMAIALTATVFAGFAPTYYLNSFNERPFALTALLHLHGAAFTAWMFLLVAQTSFIAIGARRLHMRLGLFGAILAVFMTVVGPIVAVERTATGQIADLGAPPLVFLAVPVVGMVVFAALVAAALYYRRRSPAAHKRLMLLATLELVTAGVSRFPIVAEWGPLGFFATTDVFVLAIVAYDIATLRRPHAATLWGGAFFIASQPARLVIGGSPLWLSFAGWLTS
jgi:hypothetical protein